MSDFKRIAEVIHGHVLISETTTDPQSPGGWTHLLMDGSVEDGFEEVGRGFVRGAAIQTAKLRQQRKQLDADTEALAEASFPNQPAATE